MTARLSAGSARFSEPSSFDQLTIADRSHLARTTGDRIPVLQLGMDIQVWSQRVLDVFKGTSALLPELEK